jgi:hypothetical protein
MITIDDWILVEGCAAARAKLKQVLAASKASTIRCVRGHTLSPTLSLRSVPLSSNQFLFETSAAIMSVAGFLM